MWLILEEVAKRNACKRIFVTDRTAKFGKRCMISYSLKPLFLDTLGSAIKFLVYPEN